MQKTLSYMQTTNLFFKKAQKNKERGRDNLSVNSVGNVKHIQEKKGLRNRIPRIPMLYYTQKSIKCV